MKRVSGRSDAARVCGAILSYGVAGSMLLFATLPPVIAEQTYVQAIDPESTNMPVSPAGAGARIKADASEVTDPPGNRAQFEALLREQYRGTHVFYQDLPPDAQQEYFEEYRRGVPMAELREKIVDRYFQR